MAAVSKAPFRNEYYRREVASEKSCVCVQLGLTTLPVLTIIETKEMCYKGLLSPF